MEAKKIQEVIDKLHYWDARVIKLSSDHFVDEIQLIYENDDSKVMYLFKGCYKANFISDMNFIKDKPYKNLSKPEIPYFLQDIYVYEVEKNGLLLYCCKVLMPPMEIEIECKDMEIKTI